MKKSEKSIEIKGIFLFIAKFIAILEIRVSGGGLWGGKAILGFAHHGVVKIRGLIVDGLALFVHDVLVYGLQHTVGAVAHALHDVLTVSYTHLTLPTILLV